jgi:predicted nucleic acid-binding protein
MAEPLLLEMRYSARDSEDFSLLAEELEALPLLALDGRAIQRALDAQGQLAADRRVSHRVKPIDLLVAGVADRHDAAVLHYDSDYDLIAKHTDLSFESVWVAKRGGRIASHQSPASSHPGLDIQSRGLDTWDR